GALQPLEKHDLVDPVQELGPELTAGRGEKRPGEKGNPVNNSTEILPEMEWRHEKLVLTEREGVESHGRRRRLLEKIALLDRDGAKTAVAAFEVGELIRDDRKQVGADLSRMKLIRDRLEEADCSDGNVSIETASKITNEHIERLTEVRDGMRGPATAFFEIEPHLAGKSLSDSNRSVLVSIRNAFRELTPGWRVLTEEADRNLRQILFTEDSHRFAPVLSYLLLDGASSESLAKEDSISTADAVGVLIDAYDERVDAGVAKEVEPAPDLGFRPPPEANGSAIVSPPAENGSLSLPASSEEFEIPSAEEGSLLVFRSNDVSLWGKSVYRGKNARARRLDRLPDWAKWISIRRLDTGERVYASLDGASLHSSETTSASGFNGSNELFYGARHLGLFSESCPNEVETRFTYGGWGFGHRVREGEAEEAPQASGWEGLEIDSDTVFEIVLHEELPELEESDRLVESSDESHADDGSLAR
ncbi:MAG: hypothetical protein AAGC68_06095, partial [Verrucomicrobiota bacterium]